MVQYSLTGEYINSFISIAEAKSSLGIPSNNTSSIISVCKGKQISSYGYIWRYEEDVIDSFREIIKKLDIPKFPDSYTKEECFDIAKMCRSKLDMKIRFNFAYIKSKKEGWINEYTWFNPENFEDIHVIQYDQNGNYLKEYTSSKSASKFVIGVRPKNISKCCKLK